MPADKTKRTFSSAPIRSIRVDPRPILKQQLRSNEHHRHRHRHHRMPAYRANDRTPRRALYPPRLHGTRNWLLLHQKGFDAALRGSLGCERSRAESLRHGLETGHQLARHRGPQQTKRRANDHPLRRSARRCPATGYPRATHQHLPLPQPRHGLFHCRGAGHNAVGYDTGFY